MRRLTEKELQEKRSKGLCFRCDDKWTAGHRCRRRELSVLLLDEDEEEGSEEAGSEPPQSPTEELLVERPNEVQLQPEVSLNSVVGLSNPKTVKLRGLLGNSEVVVLIDPGATHNFVSLGRVAELQIPVTDSGGFGVSLGNGETVKGTGVCKDVVIQLSGGIVVREDFLPLSLGTSDVILGIQWLEQLGEVTTNWKSQRMQFQLGGKPMTLIGDPTLVKTQISLKAMIRTLKKEKQGYWVEVNRMEAVTDDLAGQAKVQVPQFLADIVEGQKAVFAEPKGLPPSRGREHSILLKEGSNPVGVKTL